MMEQESGVIRFTKGSEEEKEFNLLCSAIAGISDSVLVEYYNEMIRRGFARTSTQDMMMNAIAYKRGHIEKEYIKKGK